MLIQTIETRPTTEGVAGAPAADRLIEGNPLFTSWLQAQAKGNVEVGVWEATPGTYKSIKGEAFEFCHILEGVAEITPDGSDQTATYRAGDNFVLNPGFTGRWKTIETIRKIFVVVR
ncbi:cupin domain-containing protein [Devosia ginsengisoli]|uniref:Cupin domain-containing protein n=1 Tax=Devosia ginsengisoli TaxID=400770 RepID=A0A5B8LY32_9HYPH|nr:cupin domain-containing protein [Devosia ginsengisoli]QDZ12709.1 cupin domain-containing protein [Devosia ginsengisoli]